MCATCPSFAGNEEQGAPVDVLSCAAFPVNSAEDLDILLDRAGECRLVLLGEASHGTSEFYTWRSDISRRLIEEKGYAFIAVEGDWATLYRLNRYVKGLEGAGDGAREIMKEFDRWPTWMWANEEMVSLIEWMREYNADLPEGNRIGFYGMDVYGPETSYRKVLDLIEEWGLQQAYAVREYYACLEDFEDDFAMYGMAVSFGMAPCDEQVLAVVELLDGIGPDSGISGTDHLNLLQNAWVVKNAEKHYRAMGVHGPHSWNHRADHFFQTIERLLEFYGHDSKGVVWAHNTHVGDARATDMASQGRRNIGQIAREQLGSNRVFSVGFGTHRGTVMAGRSWGGDREIMNVPPGISGSYEEIMHLMGKDEALIMLEDIKEDPLMLESRGHRAIGVVYHPEREHLGNYVPTVLPRRYNAFLFIDETRALSPVH